jgi:phthiodiolone/phenolphthiodiolone dimycocerosates ketoreductase
MSDQLTNFIPPSLWTPEITPMACLIPDPDSLSDPFVMASYAVASAPELGVSILTDSIRHGPAQLIHMMMTLANVTEGKALFQVGAGEVKNINPFGWKRSEGLSRMEDLYKIFQAIWDSDGPIDYEGSHLTLKRAFLGDAKLHNHELMGPGGGPKLLDLATTYGDGFSAAAPCMWATPEEWAEHITRVRLTLEQKGRDPDAYRFGILCRLLLHEDPGTLEQAMENPLLRWIAAIFGRINPLDWRKAGLEPAVPEGWTYYLKMRPYDTPSEFVEVLRKAGHEHTAAGFTRGSPEQVGARLREYVDAGVNWVGPVDYMPLILEPQDAALSLARTLEVCRELKRAA